MLTMERVFNGEVKAHPLPEPTQPAAATPIRPPKLLFFTTAKLSGVVRPEQGLVFFYTGKNPIQDNSVLLASESRLQAIYNGIISCLSDEFDINSVKVVEETEDPRGSELIINLSKTSKQLTVARVKRCSFILTTVKPKADQYWARTDDYKDVVGPLWQTNRNLTSFSKRESITANHFLSRKRITVTHPYHATVSLRL